MKRMRIPLYIVLGLALVGLVFGSFFDWSISSSIASKSNTFALIVSAFAPMIALLILPFTSGGWIKMGLKKDTKVGLRIVFFLVALLGILAPSLVGAGKEIFGWNGLYGVAPVWVGYVLCIGVHALAAIGGYFFFRKNDNPNFWIVCLILYVMVIVAVGLLPLILKAIFHRPRYRLLVEASDLSFHAWWEPFGEYKSYLASHPSVDGEDFKSFPSGHATNAAFLLASTPLLPLLDQRLKKVQFPVFFVSLGLVLLTALCRILAAAHFLSDVSFGTVLAVLFGIIANEIALCIKRLHQEKQAE